MKYYKFDVVNTTLTISSDFESALLNRKSEEYGLFQQLKEDFPTLKIVRRTHATPKAYHTKSGESFRCNQFKNLTYENMERFISALPSSEAYQKEYDFIKNTATKIQHNGYVLVRKWFTTQFPKFRKNPLFYLTNKPALVSGASLLSTVNEEIKKVS